MTKNSVEMLKNAGTSEELMAIATTILTEIEDAQGTEFREAHISILRWLCSHYVCSDEAAKLLRKLNNGGSACAICKCIQKADPITGEVFCYEPFKEGQVLVD